MEKVTYKVKVIEWVEENLYSYHDVERIVIDGLSREDAIYYARDYVERAMYTYTDKVSFGALNDHHFAAFHRAANNKAYGVRALVMPSNCI